MTEKERRLHNHAKHFAKRLAYMSADDVSGRHEAAMAAFDQEWLQLLQAHNAVLAHKFDDGLLAYEFFLLGTELRRRRRPANEQDHGAGAALQYAKRQGVIPHTHVLLILADIAQSSARPSRAEAHIRAAVRLLQRSRDKRIQSEVNAALVLSRCVLGGVLIDLGQTEEASRTCREALAGAERLVSMPLQQLALSNLGVALVKLGDLEGALETYRSAAAIARALEDRLNLQRCLANQVDVLRLLKRYDEARGAATESAALAKELGDLWEEGRLQARMAVLAADSNDPEVALEHQEAAYHKARQVGDLIGQADALDIRATIDDTLDPTEHPGESAQHAADILETIGRSEDADRIRHDARERTAAKESQARLYDTVSRISAAQRTARRRNVSDALAMMDTLVAELRELGDTALLSLVLGEVAGLLESADRFAEAAQLYDEALRIDQVPPVYGMHLLGRARVADASGNIAGALISYHAALDHFRRDTTARKEMGIALASLGGIARRMRSYNSARLCLTEAIDVLRSTQSELLQTAIADLEALDAEASEVDHSHPRPDTVLPNAKVMAILAIIADTTTQHPQMQVRAQRTDGSVVTGPVAQLLIGAVPLLALRQGNEQLVLPLEWLTELAVVLPSGRGDTAPVLWGQ
ncbi:tetratricopeptide repeat protein [Streptomyces sp. NBC_01092]|uniref:tetratricopeptide repeat protein n=1 Tax=Streptomyces sp. NBC_01092 TaxID=2903748 RepID=UPI0038709C5E|nr:tetratricopeptide repeat protein [Streptomyces sp. NBC_01092]